MKGEIGKQAEEYGYAEANKLLKANENGHTHFPFNRADISKAYLDGFAEGRKEKWHDLRENPNDLPKCEEKKQIIFYVKEFNTDIGKDTSHFCLGFYAKSFMNDDVMVFVEKSKGYECEHLLQEVIKWCELPNKE